MPLETTEIAHLVAAMLTVNEFPVDRAVTLIPAFHRSGLLDPARVAAMPQEDVIRAMSEAGYTRGGFLPIVSFRLYKLLEAVTAGRLDSLRAAATTDDEASFSTTLRAVHGWGPVTAVVAWHLWRRSLK